MAGTEQVIFGVDLDILELTEKAIKAKGLISAIGDSSNLEGLVSGLKKASIALGLVGVAALAIKGAFETVFDAEAIKQVNAQFEALTRNAGMSGDALKSGLMEASKGLIDDTDLMRIANKAMIELGDSAKRLPEIMELSRKVTATFGGELASNFEGLNRALAVGNSRALRQYGIMIDGEKATIAYAKSLGVTVASLTEAEKKQAIMNAALEKGKTAFASVDPSIKEATNTWTQLKVTVAGIMEVMTLAFDKFSGPTVKAVLKGLSDIATEMKTRFTSEFGSGADQAHAKMTLVDDRIKEIQNKIDSLTKREGFWNKLAPNAMIEGAIRDYSALLVKAKADREDLQETARHGSMNVVGAGPAEAPDTSISDAKRRIELDKFRSSLEEMRQARIDSEMNTSTDVAAINNLTEEKRLAISTETFAKIDSVYAQRALGEIASDEERDEKVAEIEARSLARLQETENAKASAIESALARQLNAATTVGEGMSAAAMASANRASSAWKKSGGVGGVALSSFQSHAVQAFKSIGDGSKSVADAMKSAFLGMLGDVAVKQGELMFLESFETWPVWPTPKTAGGLALIAAGAAIGGMAGGGASVSGGAAGGGDDFKASAAAAGWPSSVSSQEVQKKTVSLNIQGHYFETEQTKTRLVEMIRDATDATDFNIKQIGEH